MAAQKQPGAIEYIFCATCNYRTAHTLLYSYKTSSGDPDEGIWGGATHDFLSCNGCHSPTYQLTSWCSEDDPRDGPNITLYPIRENDCRKHKQFYNLPHKSLLDSIYQQTVDAFNHRLYTLAGAGVRLVIESICKEQGIVGGEVVNSKGIKSRSTKLVGKINGMAEMGIISTKQALQLHEIRFLGNDSAHETYIPSKNVISDAIDMVEHIFGQVYEQPEKARALAERDKP